MPPGSFCGGFNEAIQKALEREGADAGFKLCFLQPVEVAEIFAGRNILRAYVLQREGAHRPSYP